MSFVNLVCVWWLSVILSSAVFAQLARYFGQEIYSCIHYEEYSWYDDEWYVIVEYCREFKYHDMVALTVQVE